MIVGVKDPGKSTTPDPTFVLYKPFPAPPASGNCPLMKCRGHEVFLWQDFRCAPGKPGSPEDRGSRLDERGNAPPPRRIRHMGADAEERRALCFAGLGSAGLGWACRLAGLG